MKGSDWQLLQHCHLWLVYSFMIFPYMLIMFSVTPAAYFSPLIVLHCFCQVAKIFLLFHFNFLLHFTYMHFLNRSEKVFFENCGTQTTQLTSAPHKKRCSVGFLTCPSCANFWTKSRAEIIYHIPRKHSKATARVVFKCKIFDRFLQLLQFART